MSPRKTTFWQFCLINLFLEPYSRTKSKLSATHAVKVSDVLAISVDETPIVTDTDFKHMEEMSSDRCSEHDIESSETSLRIHSALLHPSFEIKTGSVAGRIQLTIVKVIIYAENMISNLRLILILRRKTHQQCRAGIKCKSHSIKKMKIILKSQWNTEMMLLPITYNTESARDILVTRIVLIVVVESCLEIEGMRKETEVLCQAEGESVKKT